VAADKKKSSRRRARKGKRSGFLRRHWRLILLLLVLLLAAWHWFNGTAKVQRWIWNSRNQPVNTNFSFAESVPEIEIEIAGQRPYNPNWFTQGFTIYNGKLLIGTGQRGRSRLITAGLYKDTVYKTVPLANQYFGEGVTVVRDSLIYQLTYKSGVALVYRSEDLEPRQTLSYDTEGWGLVYWPEKDVLIQSDGTSTLYYRDPETFEVRWREQVSDGIGSIAKVNEMEYVDGIIWANLWGTQYLARIDPETGEVTGKAHLGPVISRVRRNAITGVLNGVAYDSSEKVYWVTGKNWPARYAIRLSE